MGDPLIGVDRARSRDAAFSAQWHGVAFRLGPCLPQGDKGKGRAMPNHEVPAEATVSPLLAVADLNRPLRFWSA